MTLIEGMARKTPIVATRSGGPEDIVVEGETGFLVDRGDAQALAARMQALLESPELAQRLGEGGYRRVCERFNEEAARARFVPVIEEAVSDFRGYAPAVKSLANIYRLWLDQAITPPPARIVKSDSMRRLARSGIRRTKALGQRMLTALGISDTPSVQSAAQIRNVLPAPVGAKANAGPSGTPRRFHRVRQTVRYRMVPSQGNWVGLDVLVCRNPQLAPGRLRLRIRSTTGQVVRETISPLGDMGDRGWLGFRFAPIANAAGIVFDVEITAENSTPAAALGICESTTLKTAGDESPARFALPWQKKALYCKTWHA